MKNSLLKNKSIKSFLDFFQEYQFQQYSSQQFQVKLMILKEQLNIYIFKRYS